MDSIKESIGKHMTRIQGIQSTLTLMSSDYKWFSSKNQRSLKENLIFTFPF